MSEPNVRFTWNIHWSCNFRCSYCFFDEDWAEYGKRNVYKSVDEWDEHWKRIYDLYGRCYITINGGEPFAYPNFIELIERISQRHWHINITTNTSLNLDKFVDRIDPVKVSISLSFHPQYHNVDEFLEKLRTLRERKANIGAINYVAWPPFLKDTPEVIKKFEDAGEGLKVIPFVGNYEGVDYPEGYAPEQKLQMGLRDDWMDHKRHKGMVCRAGSSSALLLPDGKVSRCGQVGDRYIVGDFFDKKFKLLDSPLPCDEEFCPCDEWKVIPDEKPAVKGGAWSP